MRPVLGMSHSVSAPDPQGLQTSTRIHQILHGLVKVKVVALQLYTTPPPPPPRPPTTTTTTTPCTLRAPPQKSDTGIRSNTLSCRPLQCCNLHQGLPSMGPMAGPAGDCRGTYPRLLRRAQEDAALPLLASQLLPGFPASIREAFHCSTSTGDTCNIAQQRLNAGSVVHEHPAEPISKYALNWNRRTSMSQAMMPEVCVLDRLIDLN